MASRAESQLTCDDWVAEEADQEAQSQHTNSCVQDCHNKCQLNDYPVVVSLGSNRKPSVGVRCAGIEVIGKGDASAATENFVCWLVACTAIGEPHDNVSASDFEPVCQYSRPLRAICSCQCSSDQF